MKENVNIEELLIHILENRANEEEIRYFSKWVVIPENQVYFGKFKKLWNLSAGGHVNQEMLEAGIR